MDPRPLNHCSTPSSRSQTMRYCPGAAGARTVSRTVMLIPGKTPFPSGSAPCPKAITPVLNGENDLNGSPLRVNTWYVRETAPGPTAGQTCVPVFVRRTDTVLLALGL